MQGRWEHGHSQIMQWPPDYACNSAEMQPPSRQTAMDLQVWTSMYFNDFHYPFLFTSDTHTPLGMLYVVSIQINELTLISTCNTVCDGVIQLSGSPADPSECNLSCEGDSFKQFSCGGTNRVTIFTNGAPSPKIPTAAAAFFGPLVDVPRSTEEQNPPWNYVGCYR